MTDLFKDLHEELSDTYYMLNKEFPELSPKDCLFAALKLYQTQILIDELGTINNTIRFYLNKISMEISQKDDSF